MGPLSPLVRRPVRKPLEGLFRQLRSAKEIPCSYWETLSEICVTSHKSKFYYQTDLFDRHKFWQTALCQPLCLHTVIRYIKCGTSRDDSNDDCKSDCNSDYPVRLATTLLVRLLFAIVWRLCWRFEFKLWMASNSQVCGIDQLRMVCVWNWIINCVKSFVFNTKSRLLSVQIESCSCAGSLNCKLWKL